jgi:hypothetical protein
MSDGFEGTNRTDEDDFNDQADDCLASGKDGQRVVQCDQFPRI